MTTQPDYLILALLWLVAIPGGLFLRYGFWAAKQPPDASGLGAWWHARKGANVISIALGLLTTMLWAEGSLYRLCHLDRLGVDLSYGLTPIASAAVAFFAHYILAMGRRKAEAIAGGPVDGAGD